jgi:solute carrier family 25 carnitine/acylcarnitine transporter 20/29
MLATLIPRCYALMLFHSLPSQVGHAFDTAKVQAQIGDGRPSTSKTSFLALYRGVLPPLISTGAVRAVYFGVFEAVKPAATTALGAPRTTGDPTLPVVFVAGSITGLLTAPLTAPMQRLKLIQQRTGGSLAAAVRRVITTSGLQGLFRGLGLHSALETFGSGCYLLAYYAAKASVKSILEARRAAGGPEADVDSIVVRSSCGAFAGIVGWLSIYPLDVLRSRVMSVPPEQSLVPTTTLSRAATTTVAAAQSTVPGPRTLMAEPTITQMVSSAVRDTYASGGYRAFYRGLSFTLLRAAPVAGTVLPIYELGTKWLAHL